MEKKILAFCGEEKRVIQYREEDNILAIMRTRFNVPYDQDVMLQKYNKEWEEWINIEAFEIEDHDKVKVIPSLKMDVQISPCPSFVSSISEDMNILPTMQNPNLMLSPLQSSADELTEPPVQNSASESEVDQPAPVSSFNLKDSASSSKCSVKGTTERVTVEFLPWPTRFELPVQNMSPQLKASLKQNQFPNDKLRKQLVQVLYDAMSQYGRTPTRAQYEEVARELVQTYPVLAQHSIPSAKPYDYWKMKLSDKFRNERKNSSEEKGPKKAKIKKTPSGRAILQSLDTSGGEDSESISVHIRWMQDESKKKSPDLKKVTELMAVTFKRRREDILEKMLVTDVKKKYPFLFQTVQIHREFQRITGGVPCLSTMMTNFKDYREKILDFPFKDKKSTDIAAKLTARISSQPSQEKVEELKEWAIALIPFLFKMDPCAVMGFLEERNHENSSPYLTFEGNSTNDYLDVKSFYITVEGERFGTAKSMPEGLALLISSYWIFDMQYPKEGKDFFNFIEVALLKLETVKATRCVSSMLAKLNTP